MSKDSDVSPAIVVDEFSEPSGDIRGIAVAMHDFGKKQPQRVLHAMLHVEGPPAVTLDKPAARVTLDQVWAYGRKLTAAASTVSLAERSAGKLAVEQIIQQEEQIIAEAQARIAALRK